MAPLRIRFRRTVGCWWTGDHELSLAWRGRIPAMASPEPSFLILHGIDNERPPDHWQHILATALRERGHRVLYPQLPEPCAPRFECWQEVLWARLAELHGGERVVICHSLACCLWLRSAAAVAARDPIDRLLLVSPPESASLPDNGACFRYEGVDAPGPASELPVPGTRRLR